MIFSQGERFKKSHRDALCPCKCTEYWDMSGKKTFGSTKGPKIVPDAFPKKTEIDNSSPLYPKIDPVRPRSATVYIRGSNRFGPTMEKGKDSPGPKYTTAGLFDKSKRYRNRSFSTFGLGTRLPTKKSDEELLVQDAIAAFNMTQPRSRGALVLGRLSGYLQNDSPGPGAYALKRDPVPTSKVPVMRPDYARKDKPVHNPGYLDVSIPIIKKTHSHANFGAHRDMCEHSENHNYCCRNCCKLCRNRSPVRAKVESPVARPKSAANVSSNNNSSSHRPDLTQTLPTPSPSPGVNDSDEYAWNPVTGLSKSRPRSAPPKR